jgi:hypothetical protein
MSHKWVELAELNAYWYQWSRDGKSLYFTDTDHRALFRLRIDNRQTEHFASLKDLQLAEGVFGSWLGLTPDDSPLLLRDTGTREVYGLHWQTP